jgi:hypothetical protein
MTILKFMQVSHVILARGQSCNSHNELMEHHPIVDLRADEYGYVNQIR